MLPRVYVPRGFASEVICPAAQTPFVGLEALLSGFEQVISAYKRATTQAPYGLGATKVGIRSVFRRVMRRLDSC